MNGAAGRSRRGAVLLHPAVLVPLAVMVLAAVSLAWYIRANGLRITKLPIYAKDNLQLRSIPGELPPTGDPRWVQLGPDRQMGAEEIAALGSANAISRVYQRADTIGTANPVAFELHAVYYTGMIDAVPHVPERCVVAGGGEMLSGPRITPVPLDLSPDAGVLAEERDGGEIRYSDRSGVTFQRIPLPRGVEHLAMSISSFDQLSSDQDIWAGYFFIANGGVVASASGVRGLAYRLDSDYAYYAKIQFSSVTVGSAEELASLAADALRDLFPEIMRCMPNWDEVEAGTWDFTDYSKQSG
ncbi:MAG: hypothetical protein NXI14_02805 [bacterium]|nr:hypothetical protein [bacterium]